MEAPISANRLRMIADQDGGGKGLDAGIMAVVAIADVGIGPERR